VLTQLALRSLARTPPTSRRHHDLSAPPRPAHAALRQAQGRSPARRAVELSVVGAARVQAVGPPARCPGRRAATPRCNAATTAAAPDTAVLPALPGRRPAVALAARFAGSAPHQGELRAVPPVTRLHAGGVALYGHGLRQLQPDARPRRADPAG